MLYKLFEREKEKLVKWLNQKFLYGKNKRKTWQKK